MSGFFKSIGTLFYNLNETESYKDLRQLIQNVGINSSHFNQNKNPFDLIEKSYLKYDIKDFNPDDYMSNTSGIPKWFNEITNEYLKLDMHGFKADKIKVTEKEKNTFKNTTEDASHSSFASMCEFYITNDDKNYQKTKAVFEKLNIRTKVLKPQEFVEYFRNYLNIEGFENHFRSVIASIKEVPIWRKQFDDNGNLFGNIGYSNKYFFNFFNKIMLPEEDENVAFLILSKESPANTFIISFLEIENLVKSFVNHLGPDFYGKTYFDVEEVKENRDWCGRVWKTSIGEFVLMSLNNKFQLYLYKNHLV